MVHVSHLVSLVVRGEVVSLHLVANLILNGFELGLHLALGLIIPLRVLKVIQIVDGVVF